MNQNDLVLCSDDLTAAERSRLKVASLRGLGAALAVLAATLSLNGYPIACAVAAVLAALCVVSEPFVELGTEVKLLGAEAAGHDAELLAAEERRVKRFVARQALLKKMAR